VITSVQQLALDHPLLFDDPQWAANIERALLDAFFGVLVESPSVAAPPDRLRSARRIVLETEARLDPDPISIPSISSLCSAIRISRRTMERAFQDMLGMSPAQYLRVRALNVAREQLLRRPPMPGLITRVAIDSGFWHMGRFSVSYRRLFGERPIETLRQSRNSYSSPGPSSAKLSSVVSWGERRQ
jgi:AraC-like DNA-binding protein